MKKKNSDWGGFALLLSILCILYTLESCTLPTDDEVIQWDFSLTVPAIQEQVHIVESLDSLAKENNDEEADISIETDSLVRMVHRDTFDTEFDLFPFFEKTSASEEEEMGLITLSGLGETVIPISIQRFEVPKEIRFSLPIESELFEHLRFDASSPALPLQLSNLSTTNTISSITIELRNSGVTATAAQSISPIGPGTSGTITLPMAEKELSTEESLLEVTLTYTQPLTPADQSELSFSFDNMVINRGTFNDALLPDLIEVPISKKLADSLLVQAILFEFLTINCRVENRLNMDVAFNGIILQSTGTQTTLWNVPPQLMNGYQEEQAPLRNVELYPFWDTEEAESYFNFVFQIAPIKKGVLFSYDAKNSIEIELLLEDMRFTRIGGSFPFGLEKVIEADEWKLPQLFSMANQQEVLGKMFTKGATMEAVVTAFQDLDSRLDSLELTIETNCDNILGTMLTDTLVQSFTTLQANKFDTISTSMDAIINNFPNTLQGNLLIKIPAATGFSLVARENDLTIPVSVINKMDIPLQYGISEPVAILSEVHQIGIPNEQLQVVKKLENPVLTLTVTVENNSPLELSLFGIGSSLADSTLLDSIEHNQFTPDYIELSGLEESLFYMTGNKELTLANSGSTATTTWEIRGNALESFIKNDSLATRFLVKMPAKESAVVTNESHLSVKTAISINGLMSANKLIDEEEEDQ